MTVERKPRSISNVILETRSGDDINRYVISYDEWVLIEKWYSSTEDKEDYIFRLSDGTDIQRIVRLDKKISEIRAIKLNRPLSISKNLSCFLLSKVPGGLRFMVPLCISISIWAVLGIISLFKSSGFDFISSATKLTSLTFILFLLLIAQAAVVKVLELSRNTCEAFIFEHDGYLTDTIVFNLGLILLFVLIGTENIIGFISSLISFLGV